MNVKQMKQAISQFRSADVSLIKDDKLRAKAHKLQAKEKGFTLLELLVVITLLAILATGALVAYDGAGEKAQASKAANTIGVLDQGVRAYRAVSQSYPDQWDNLADPVTAATAAGGAEFLPESLQDLMASFPLRDAFENADVNINIADYFEEGFGMEEVQHVFGGANGLNGVEPNRAYNEGTNPATGGDNGAVETEYSDFVLAASAGPDAPAYVSILASVAIQDDELSDGVTANPTAGTPMTCTVGGQDISTAWTANIANADRPNVLNSINDALSTERCNLVLALGFGGDAAQSTVDSAAGVIQAPTYSSASVNPAENYGRYVGLFLLASGEKGGVEGNGVDNLVAENFLPRPRLLGFIDTEGNTIDANIAAATQD